MDSFLIDQFGNPFEDRISPNEWFGTGIPGAWMPLSSTGKHVTEDNIYTAPPVLCAIKTISEAIAGFPLNLYEPTEDGLLPYKSHPLFYVLRHKPNQELSSYEYWRQVVADCLIWGNHLSQIITNSRGDVLSLNPIPWSAVEDVSTTGQGLVYKIQGEALPLVQSQVLHVKAFGKSPIQGLATIKHAKDAIGVSLALQEYIGSYFRNGAVPTLKFKIEQGKPSPEQKAAIRSDFRRIQTGVNNHNVVVLGAGTDVEPLAVTNRDAEILGLLQASVTDVARMFKIPPPLLMEMSKMTLTNVREMKELFLTVTLDSWLSNIESAVESQLLTKDEVMEGVTVDFDTSSLTRLDEKTRWEKYQIATFSGAMTLNEVRQKENLPLYPPELGDVPFVQTAMIPLNQLISGFSQNISGSQDGIDDEDVQGTQEEDTNPSQRSTCGCGHDHGSPSEKATEGPTEAPEDEERTITLEDGSEIRVLSDAQRLLARRSSMASLRDATSRLNVRFSKDIKALISKDPTAPVPVQLNRIKEYLESQKDFIRKVYSPVMTDLSMRIGIEAARQVGSTDVSAVEKLTQDYIDSFVNSTILLRHGLLKKVSERAEDITRVPEAVEAEITSWTTESESQRVAEKQSVKIDGYIAAGIWAARGVIKKRWRTTGENCPFCQSLNGKAVGISDGFIKQGDFIKSNDNYMEFSKPKKAPPLHSGCDCSITPSI